MHEGAPRRRTALEQVDVCRRRGRLSGSWRRPKVPRKRADLKTYVAILAPQRPLNLLPAELRLDAATRSRPRSSAPRFTRSTIRRRPRRGSPVVEAFDDVVLR